MKKEIKIYKRLENGKFEKAENTEKREKRSNRKGVIRLSDGKEYSSIQKCRIDNNICRYRIYNELKKGTNFKLKE
jgi:hypothetical protein